MILGVDVADLQGEIDWQRFRAQGVAFAWLRCTIGNERGRDSRFARNVVGAKAAGVLVGAYHFCYPLPHGAQHPAGRSPVEQARRAFAESDQLGRLEGELPPACDIEWPPQWEKDKATGELTNQWNRWGVTAASIVSWTLAFLAEAERLWSRTPVLYTYPHFWRDLGAEGKRPEFRRYPLWIANYTHLGPGLPRPGAQPIVPGPWERWTIWQYSANGGARLDGCATDIDRNAFAGTSEELAVLAAGVPPVNVEEEPPTRPDLPASGESDAGIAEAAAATFAARREMTAEAVADFVRDED